MRARLRADFFWSPIRCRADLRAPGTVTAESAIRTAASGAACPLCTRQWRYDSTAAAIVEARTCGASAGASPTAACRGERRADDRASAARVFRGCWQGEVNELDWIRREPGAHKVGFWTPKTYRLCYKRVGDQPFSLTFTETGVAPNDKILNPRGNVVPIMTDGRAYAAMQSRLNFDEYKTLADGMAPTFAVDETTNLDCRIAGDDMMVTADVYGTRDGEPWFRARWRADFRRFEN
jgi:hypothetical protein